MVIEKTEPAFREMSKKESEDLLRRSQVGRVAFSFHDVVDIRPLHYVYDNGWLFGRTSAGDTVTTMRHNQWIAFEADEITGPLDWNSVLVRGTFYLLKPEGSVHDLRLYNRGMSAVRRLFPDAFTDRDPLAFRSELFGISIARITGRSCSTKE